MDRITDEVIAYGTPMKQREIGDEYDELLCTGVFNLTRDDMFALMAGNLLEGTCGDGSTVLIRLKEL